MPCSCACRQHDQFSAGKTSYVHKISNKKIKADVLNFMKINDLVPKNAAAICQLCIDHVRSNLTQSTGKRKVSIVDDVVQCISEGSLNNDELGEIAQAIGSHISSQIYEDCISCSDSYKETGSLKDFSVSNWLRNRNRVLLTFLRSSADCISSNNIKKELCIANAVDSLYKARKLTHVAPLPFCQNLIAYYISGSKVLTQIHSRQQACGSYTTLQHWLRSSVKQPIQNSPKGDQVTFFDNNQTVARNWRVTFGHKTTASVITMLLHIEPNIGTSLQESTELSPRHWLYETSPDTTATLISEAMSAGEVSYERIRNSFLADRLHSLATGGTDAVKDKLDGFFGPIKKEEYVDPYAWVPSGHLPDKAVVRVGEPALLNSCSYESVKNVLKHIQDQCGVGRNKRWTCIGCDGLPYALGSRLQESNVDLRDILLIPGQGHIEMNAVKACFRLLWDVCLEDLAKIKGEGGDFVLEAFNRRSKRWLPPGIPQQHHWLQVCRSLDLLEEIRKNTFEETGINEIEPTVYQRDMSTEILEWRASSGYLSNTRSADSAHLSVSGQILDRDLVNFESRCVGNIHECFDAIRKRGLPGKRVSLTPVFTTPLQRSNFHNIEKKTKLQIISMIETAINDIQCHGNMDEAFTLAGQWKKIKVKTKKDMLMFYKEVLVALENATAVESDNDESDDTGEVDDQE